MIRPGERIAITVVCDCGSEHPSDVWTTATRGLVVRRTDRCSAVDRDTDDAPLDWTIVHGPTGLALRALSFEDPEAAQGAAAALDPVWDWTRVETPPRDVGIETAYTLIDWGALPDGHGGGQGDPQPRNPGAW